MVGNDLWKPLVMRWDSLGDPAFHSSVASSDIAVWNGLQEFGNGPERFSNLLNRYPPETATAFVYRWFDGESLDESDLVPIFHGRPGDPIVIDLKKLMEEADLSLNLPVSAGDVLYVPKSSPAPSPGVESASVSLAAVTSASFW